MGLELAICGGGDGWVWIRHGWMAVRSIWLTFNWGGIIAADENERQVHGCNVQLGLTFSTTLVNKTIQTFQHGGYRLTLSATLVKKRCVCCLSSSGWREKRSDRPTRDCLRAFSL